MKKKNNLTDFDIFKIETFLALGHKIREFVYFKEINEKTLCKKLNIKYNDLESIYEGQLNLDIIIKLEYFLGIKLINLQL